MVTTDTQQGTFKVRIGFECREREREREKKRKPCNSIPPLNLFYIGLRLSSLDPVGYIVLVPDDGDI
jgi:hypothetical protein